MFFTLRAMKAPRRKNSMQHDIHIHQMYNVKHFTNTGSFNILKEDAMTRFINVLIKALDDNHSMPRIIMLMLDHEFLFMLDHVEFGISLMIGKCLHWLVSQTDQEIRLKKTNLSL